MIDVAYDINSFTVNHLGGISRVCYHTISEASKHSAINPTAFYRKGTVKYFDLPDTPLIKYSPLSNLFSKKYMISHSLCHRLLPVKAYKKIYTIHDVWTLKENCYQPDKFRKKLAKRLLIDIKKADHIVTISETTKKNLLELNVIPEEKCTAVHLGVEPFPEVKSILNNKINKIIKSKYVLYVGCFEIRKNIQHILDAVLPIKDIKLVLAGSNGFGYDDLIKPNLDNFPQDRILRLNHVERSDLRHLYQNAVTAILPSWEEGFGLPILEAMINGCPMITSNRSANAEIGHDAAILVNPEDPSESQTAIEKLINDVTFRNDIIRSGKKRASEFSWSKYINSLSKLYQSLL